MFLILNLYISPSLVLSSLNDLAFHDSIPYDFFSNFFGNILNRLANIVTSINNFVRNIPDYLPNYRIYDRQALYNLCIAAFIISFYLPITEQVIIQNTIIPYSLLLSFGFSSWND